MAPDRAAYPDDRRLTRERSCFVSDRDLRTLEELGRPRAVGHPGIAHRILQAAACVIEFTPRRNGRVVEGGGLENR
jgi:hypothetical protein